MALHVALFGLLLSKVVKGEAFQHSMAAISANADVRRLLGEPLESGFVMGSVKNKSSEGSAAINYSLSGPKGEAKAYVYACKHMDEWMLYNVVVKTKDGNNEIEVVPFNPEISALCF